VTFLTPEYTLGPSGGIRVVYEYANRLVARGHQVTVVHPRRLRYCPPEKLTPYYRLRGWMTNMRNILVKPTIDWQPIDKRVKSLYVSSSASSYIPEGDAIFATSWMTVRSVLECPKNRGEKFYLIQHYETWMGPKELVDATWRSQLHKVVIAKWLFDVGKQLGCHDMAYIPNAVDHDRYNLVRPIEGRPRRVAMLFAKVPFKGAADGIEALRIARERYPDLRAVLFGATNFRPSIPSWIEYHSSPAQDFIIKDIYGKSSIFLCPSWSEGFALPPAEAAACGCAVVATENGGVGEYIQNGVTGLLSPPRNPTALAENLCLLLGNEDLRIRLAKACNNCVSRLSWDESTASLERFITEVLQSSASTSTTPAKSGCKRQASQVD